MLLVVGVESDNGCLGHLKEPCRCIPANISITIECLNGQFTDIDLDYFAVVGSGHFPTLRYLTFHGNQFTHLPSNLFGPYVENVAGLQNLNLSHNFIRNISNESFCGLESLELLDLSYNKLILFSDRDQDLSIFKPIGQSLRRLYLKNAFDQPLDSKLQMIRLTRISELADFRQLTFLDLSSNSLNYFPKTFLCNFRRSLTFALDLSHNSLTTIEFQINCLRNLKILNLSANKFKILDTYSMATIAAVKTDYAIRLDANIFECNCNSSDFLLWLQKSVTKFHDVENIVCKKASPKALAGKPVVNVNVNDLDCNIPVSKAKSNIIFYCILEILSFAFFISYLSNLLIY
uniref:LRRCT domain-containing protein n=1 Tax=Romanomermis culicivorax TaxID=13658 RepID=A0A915L5L1_ROMCU